MIKTISKLGREGDFLTVIEKKNLQKTYTTIILNGEKHEASSLRWKRNSFPLEGRRQRYQRI